MSNPDIEALEEQKRKLDEMIAQTKEKQKILKAQKEAAEKKKKEIAGSTGKEVDIHIKFTPQRILKIVIVIVAIVAVFMIGRLTAEDSASESGGKGSFFSALFGGKSSGEAVKQPTVQAVAVEEAPEEKEVPPPVEETPPEEEVPPEPLETETTTTGSAENVVTTYSKVAVSLTKPIIEWKQTWGKVTELDYTIKNNEGGTVKPSYFIMKMEGYDDLEKKVPIASNDIKAGATDTATVLVPGGFAYNEITAGTLENVLITLILHDADDKPMASFSKEYNLKG